MGGRFIQWTEVDVEIKVGSVVDFIENYADKDDLEIIKTAMRNVSFPVNEYVTFKSTDGTYIKNEKLQLLSSAFKKYSLEELENRLGTKFDLI
jgi:hypothetical protein